MTPAQKERLEEMRTKLLDHVGHVLQYVSNGHRKNYGILERIKIDESHVSLILWMSQVPQDFDRPQYVIRENYKAGQDFFYIYLDQFVGCTRCASSKPEAPEGDTSRFKVKGKS